MSARTIRRAAPLVVPVLALATAGTAAAQEAPPARGDGLDEALVVAVQGVLERLHQQGSVPAQPRLVVTPDGAWVTEGGAATGGGGPPAGGAGAESGIPGVLAERLGARVAELDDVQACPAEPDTPGACTLEDVDAVLSVGAVQGGAERADVDVLVTYAVPRIVYEPVRSVAFRVGLSRLGTRWTVTSVRQITTM